MTTEQDETPKELRMTDTDTYSLSKSLNWSSLKHMATSPLEYQWRIGHPEPPKTTYLMGNAIHCRGLEPEKFNDRYALCDITRNKRHKAYQEWMEENEGKKPLKQSEMDNAKHAGDAVLAHGVAAEILKGCRHEEPLSWTDPDTGLKCKGRTDAIRPEFVVDLKTSQDPSPRAFTRDAAKYLYHGQLSFYHQGALTLRKIDGKITPYIIACAKEPPYDVAVYTMKPDDLHAGRQLCLSLMRKLEECLASDLWPGCAPDLQYLELPSWAPGFDDEQQGDW